MAELNVAIVGEAGTGLPSGGMTSIRSRALASGSLLLALLSATAPALADATPEDRASADQLYNDASKLMTAGSYAEACPKLGASQRLDPAIGTLLKLGFCFAYAGQTASAWASFNDAEAMARKAGDKARAAEAAKRAHELEAKLSRLTIAIEVEATAPDVEVRRDGAVVDRSVLGAALPVDPGAHVISASAPGKATWTSSITVAAGPGTTTVRVPALLPAPVAEAPPPPASPPAEAPAPPPRPPAGWSTQRKVALGVGAAGVVGVAVGAIFGAVTLGKTSEARGYCSKTKPPQCEPMGVTLYSAANRTANVSNVAMGVGGAAVIAGVVLFLTAPAGGASRATAPEKTTLRVLPAVGLGSAGILWQGAW